MFTITGKDIPNNFVIRILTLNGKVVKEITQDEIGPLHAGINRTSYKWNGTDEFGEALANGVYLYKMFIQSDNEPFGDYSLGDADDFFNKGFGKMVILR